MTRSDTRTQGVIFDLDETLLDRRTSISAYARRLRTDLADRTRLEEEPFVALFHRLDGNGRVDRDRFFSALAAQAFAGVDAARVRAHFVDLAWVTPLLFPTVVETLRTLRKRAVRIGIVTNGNSVSQNAKLRNSGLVDLVDAHVVSKDFGSAKPEPAIFEHMIETLGIERSRSWFVGDDPKADIRGAKRVGLKAAWIRRHTAWPDDLPICHDAELVDVSGVLPLL